MTTEGQLRQAILDCFQDDIEDWISPEKERYVFDKLIDYIKSVCVTDYGLGGVLNGTNKAFYLLNNNSFVEGTTQLWINGVRQYKGIDYGEYGDNYLQIYLAPHEGDALILDYLKK